ncbi:MAG: [Clostridia bacterium]|nr:[FeFe] hydrogenase H-cluster maturation GTPase HydF [Clostridia bacterium]
MSVQSTPSANRIHIGFFGRRNAGKSSTLNAVTGQAMAVVSAHKGTTTDPVLKAMELLPLGPVMVIDTPGFDDAGSLGELRVQKTLQILRKTDIAVLVADATEGLGACEQELLSLFEQRDIPYLIAYNKCDVCTEREPLADNALYISAKTGEGIEALKERVAALRTEQEEKPIAGDLLAAGDTVLLVVPIDTAAPKGRLILPQVQTIRDILDAGARALVVKENEVEGALQNCKQPPRLVITDSQVFAAVSKAVPRSIPLTSFSILMARYKGYLATAVRGVKALNTLKEGDRVLIAEGCTHHRRCEDIGTVKIPRWLKQATGCRLEIETCSGTAFPEDLSPYKLIIHCGGCMLNEREVKYRMKAAEQQGVPFTNYGIFIAAVTGILERSVEMLDIDDKSTTD